jgi:hypothetical protein
LDKNYQRGSQLTEGREIAKGSIIIIYISLCVPTDKDLDQRGMLDCWGGRFIACV